MRSWVLAAEVAHDWGEIILDVGALIGVIVLFLVTRWTIQDDRVARIVDVNSRWYSSDERMEYQAAVLELMLTVLLWILRIIAGLLLLNLGIAIDAAVRSN